MSFSGLGGEDSARPLRRCFCPRRCAGLWGSQPCTRSPRHSALPEQKRAGGRTPDLASQRAGEGGRLHRGAGLPEGRGAPGGRPCLRASSLLGPPAPRLPPGPDRRVPLLPFPVASCPAARDLLGFSPADSSLLFFGGLLLCQQAPGPTARLGGWSPCWALGRSPQWRPGFLLCVRGDSHPGEGTRTQLPSGAHFYKCPDAE